MGSSRLFEWTFRFYSHHVPTLSFILPQHFSHLSKDPRKPRPSGLILSLAHLASPPCPHGMSLSSDQDLFCFPHGPAQVPRAQ